MPCLESNCGSNDTQHPYIPATSIISEPFYKLYPVVKKTGTKLAKIMAFRDGVVQNMKKKILEKLKLKQ